MLLSSAFGLDITQSQVDFVIPDVDHDLRLCIDPFLLFKSKDPYFRSLHTRIIEAFGLAFVHFRTGNISEAHRLVDFPEVPNIGFGYSHRTVRGSGMGVYLNRLVADTLAASPALLARGIRHIEELQLVSLGIGPDRVSDIAANLLKAELATYTKQQCDLWGIPLARGVPLEHIFDLSSFEWHDEYVDLPLNPRTHAPMIFVPRRMVRMLPWINFDDYERQEYRLYLRPRQGAGWDRFPGERARIGKASKQGVVEVTRRHIELLDRYVIRKESRSSNVHPELVAEAGDSSQDAAADMIAFLDRVTPGISGASEYQRGMLGVLNFLFSPDLVDGKLEERTIDGTERRDIVFTNEADHSFWEYVRQQYGGLLVMFEAKNVREVDSQHINQTATYLGDRIGKFGVILTRNPPSIQQVRKVHSVFSNDRKSILIIHDGHIKDMVNMNPNRGTPTTYVQKLYRNFKLGIE